MASDEIRDILTRLIQISRQILVELESDKPSLDDISLLMERRQDPIRELTSYAQRALEMHPTPTTPMEVQALYKELSTLNRRIVPELKQLRKQQEVNLREARHHRQAEEKYRGTKREALLEKPDISYYQ